MKKVVLLCIALLHTGILFSQATKPDFNGLKKKRYQDNLGTIKVRYFDNHDSVLYEVNYNANGAVENGDFGMAIQQHLYDEKNDRVETRFLDKNFKLVRVEGVAIIKRKFDQNHRQVEEANCYENGQSVKSAHSVYQFKYDDRGNRTERIVLNEKRVLSAENPIKRYKNDEKGRRIEEALFDKNNKLIKTGGKFEHSITKFEYSDDNRIIKKMFFTEQGVLIDGNAIVKIVYDKRPPQKTSVDSFDSDPTWLELTWFDKNGKELEMSYEYVPKTPRYE